MINGKHAMTKPQKKVGAHEKGRTEEGKGGEGKGGEGKGSSLQIAPPPVVGQPDPVSTVSECVYTQ
jgi:hypothetical protein